MRSASSSLAELYERHVGRMVGLARLLTGDAGAAEDIAHDAFIRAASKLGTLRDPERLDTYLQRTVVNLCHSRGRRRSVETAWLRRARPADAVQPPSTETRDEVWKAVPALPDRQRAAVGNAPVRPADFETWMSTGQVDDSPACLSAPKDFVHHSGTFSDAGREFDLYVAYGASASPKTLSELWVILNGMTFTIPSSP
jgi:hypothetical protein